MDAISLIVQTLLYCERWPLLTVTADENLPAWD